MSNQPDKPVAPEPTPVHKIDLSGWGVPLSILLGFAMLVAGQHYLPSVDPTPLPLPPAPVVVEPTKPTIADSIAETNGERNDAIKSQLVAIIERGNGNHTLRFQPDKKKPIIWTVTVSGGDKPDPSPPIPPIPPGPDPGPKPPIPPEPGPDPPPIPQTGFRVLIVYENNPSDPAAVLTKEQRGAMSSQAVRSYLDSKCAKGKDGKTPEWRMFDQHVDLANETEIWKEAMKLPRNVLPWIVISDGKAGYSGPLPANETELLALLRKHGGQ